MTSVKPDVVAASLNTVSRFVLRARRVEQHSLAAGKKQLILWASGTMRVKVVNDVPQSVSFDLPDEEALDSLAARCRPFVLQEESVYHAKVTKALGYLLRDHADHSDQIKNLRSRWQRLDRSRGVQLGYTSRTGEVGGSLGEPVTDLKLAYAWLYGDLVHADDIAVIVGDHDIDSRYAGAVLLVSNIAVTVVATLNFVRAVKQDGSLSLDEHVFTEPVVARGGTFELPLTALAIAAAGTPREDLEAVLDSSGRPSPEDN